MVRKSLAILFTLMVASPATAAPVQLQAKLTGTAAGDPKGSGKASLSVDPDKSEVCYVIEVSGIAPASAAHIHRVAAESFDPPVVSLRAPSNGKSEGCAWALPEDLRAIAATPAEFYVNVHNGPFPDGALRGQLVR